MATTHFRSELEAGVSHVEQMLGEVSTALMAGDPPVLEVASTALRQAMLDLARLQPSAAGSRPLDAGMRQRLDKIALLLAQQREHLIRRAVVVDRALQAVLPQAQTASTYSGGAKAGVYRGAAARIYAAVAT